MNIHPAAPFGAQNGAVGPLFATKRPGAHALGYVLPPHSGLEIVRSDHHRHQTTRGSRPWLRPAAPFGARNGAVSAASPPNDQGLTPLATSRRPLRGLVTTTH